MKKSIIFAATMMTVLMVFCLFPKENASAYWTSKDGKQCFSVQYEYANKTKNNGKSAQDGNTPSETITAKSYSTQLICATVDANGKATGKLTYGGYPAKNTRIPVNDEKVKVAINSDGTAVIVSTCSKTGLACENGSAVKRTEYKLSDSGTFKQLANKVISGAPDKYGKGTKKGLEENINKDTVKKKAESMAVNEGTNDSGDEPGSVTQNCANAGGAQSLGWIVCPIMSWIGDAATYTYNEIVEPSLKVEPQLFTDSQSDVEGAWGTFRDIANIIFVILLLIVIFSQLTGVGIDNYGIKKILPKLIIAAVLINLSYLLCVIAVDISNIAGNGLQALFDGLGDGLNSSVTIEIGPANGDAETTPLRVAKRGMASVAVLGAAVISVGAIWTNPAIVLSLLVSALGILIAIFFLFILLATRQAAIVVLTVISPVAVVCYMLPNTKKLFDKWLKAMEGLLLVYPICGLLVGGGNYVAKLLLFSDFGREGFIAAFTAMVAGIMPIFFIPAVLKNSFAALGGLGARIAGFGQRVSGRATGMARDSGAYKNAQEAGKMRELRLKGGIGKDGTPVTGWRRTLASISSGGRKSRLRNASGYQRMVAEQGALEAAEGEDFMLRTQTTNVMRQLEASGDINNIGGIERDNDGNITATTGLTGGLYNALRTGNRAQIRAYTDALSAKGDSGRDAVKAAWNTAVGTGAVSVGAANAFGNNIMENHAAAYKNDARSMFETAKNAQNATDANASAAIHRTSDVHTGTLAMGAKASTMVSMDDKEFESTFASGWEQQVAEQAINNAGEAARNEALENDKDNVAAADAAMAAAIAKARTDGTGEAAVQAVKHNAWKAIQDDPNMKSSRYNDLKKVAEGYRPGSSDYVQVEVANREMSVPHNKPGTNIGGGGGADSVSE